MIYEFLFVFSFFSVIGTFLFQIYTLFDKRIELFYLILIFELIFYFTAFVISIFSLDEVFLTLRRILDLFIMLSIILAVIKHFFVLQNLKYRVKT